MPLVSTVGRRSLGVRILFMVLYVILCIGGFTMVYPFLLMLTMGTTSNADAIEYRILPKFWLNDTALFKKYIFDATSDGAYSRNGWYRSGPNYIELSGWFGKDSWFSPLAVKNEDFEPVLSMNGAHRRARAADFTWYISNICPDEFKMPAFLRDRSSPLSMNERYATWLMSRYTNLGMINRVHDQTYVTPTDIAFFPMDAHRRPAENTPFVRDGLLFLRAQPPERLSLVNANAGVYGFLTTFKDALPKDYRPLGQKTGRVNKAIIPYEDIMAGKLGMKAKEQFLRRYPARFIRIDAHKADGAWRSYLAARGTPYYPVSDRLPIEESKMGAWSVFAATRCPIDALSTVRPEDSFRPYLAKIYANIAALNRAYGTGYVSFDEVKLPFAEMHAEYFLKNKSELRGKYFGHNFFKGISFIALHGDSLIVTIVYILLAIASALTINPMAAYAMSRFRLKESHYILLFLLSTMAFPAEVLMIPNFLSIKSFPVVQILVIGASLTFFFLLVHNLQQAKIRIPIWLSATVGLVVTGFLAGYLVPTIAKRYDVQISVTLMNSFWALILPGLANGYGIFLLKGFFDTVPPELYEAGLIDGANELQLFWNVTLPLSRPIMAVLALNAFTHAYGAFMHAFLTCQDPKMWTLMVFLYEYQQYASVPMVMASLVITSIPTLIVFILAQKVILEGIVVPSFK